MHNIFKGPKFSSILWGFTKKHISK